MADEIDYMELKQKHLKTHALLLWLTNAMQPGWQIVLGALISREYEVCAAVETDLYEAGVICDTGDGRYTAIHMVQVSDDPDAVPDRVINTTTADTIDQLLGWPMFDRVRPALDLIRSKA